MNALVDSPDGMAVLNQRLERRSRTVPPPRHPAKTLTPSLTDSDETPVPVAPKFDLPAIDTSAEIETVPAESRTQGGSDTQVPTAILKPEGIHWLQDPIPPGVNEPMANLAVRVRKSLDDRLADVVHDLRRQGLRTSKAEVVEMLIAALPAQIEPGLSEKLMEYRSKAPRP